MDARVSRQRMTSQAEIVNAPPQEVFRKVPAFVPKGPTGKFAKRSEFAPLTTAITPLVRQVPFAKFCKRLGLVLLAVGIIGRLGRYFLRFPIWGDEGMVLLNVLDRDFLQLTKELDFGQIAPILFLWAEKTAMLVLGGGEYAMRLLPLLAGCGSLFLFRHFARRTVRPLAAALALGFLAVGRWPVSMSAFTKPYSIDLLMSLIFLIAGALWLERRNRSAWLWTLVPLGPIAVASSYPSIFVFAAVALVLAWPVWQQGRRAIVPYLLFAALTSLSFLACYLLVGREKLHADTADVIPFMRNYWAMGFPPSSPLAFLKWLYLLTAGRMMAYPFGDANGGSTATFILFCVGVWSFWKSKRFYLLGLLLLPFLLNLAASAFRLFPYGGCCRLAQHLAPAVCLLAGSGLALCLERFTHSELGLRRAAWTAFSLLVFSGTAGLMVDLAMPYRDQGAEWCRGMVRELNRQARPQDQIVLINPRLGMEPNLTYGLSLLGDRVAFDGHVDWKRLQAENGRLLLVEFWTDKNGSRIREDRPVSIPPEIDLQLALLLPYSVPPCQRFKNDPTNHGDVYFYTPAAEVASVRRYQRINCFPDRSTINPWR